MNEETPFEPNTVPPSWDAGQDIKDDEARFGFSDNYYAEAFTRIAYNYVELDGLVSQALAYFGDSDDDISPVTLDAKLLRLKRWLSRGTSGPWYVERMTSVIELSLKVLREHETIMRIYANRSEALWLYPLSDLADWISTAEFKLREAMGCEHRDLPAE